MRIKITKNFYLDEFMCRDQSDVNLEVFNNILKLAEQPQNKCFGMLHAGLTRLIIPLSQKNQDIFFINI